MPSRTSPEYNRKYLLEHKEQIRAYRLKNSDKVKEWKHNYYVKHREQIRTRAKERYETKKVISKWEPKKIVIEEMGNRYHRLTVIKEAGRNKDNNALWECQCDCGNTVFVSGSSLRNGHTKSCGCQRIDSARVKWTMPGETSFKSLYGIYKRGSAERRNLEFTLTIDQFREIIAQNCFYCGCPPSNSHYRTRGNGAYSYNGIDRVDNNKGYILENVVPCCKRCNYMKREMGQEDFINHVVSIYNNLKLGISQEEKQNGSNRL